jgi:stage III sporulation protein AE
MMTIVLRSVGLAIKGATAAIEGMAGFMEVLAPLLMAAMMSLGQVGAVTVMQPLVLGVMSFLTGQIHFLLFPLIMIYLALVLADSLSEGLSVAKLAKFLKQTIQWGLGLAMTIFTAVLAISGSFAAVADGLSLRTAKYLAGNLVPVAGKLFADVLDTAAGAVLILKNSIGLIGMVSIVAIMLIPLTGIFLQAMLFKLAGAVVEPLGDSRTSGILDELGNVMMLLFTVLGAIGIMVLLTLSAVLLAGNTAVMLR